MQMKMQKFWSIVLAIILLLCFTGSIWAKYDSYQSFATLLSATIGVEAVWSSVILYLDCGNINLPNENSPFPPTENLPEMYDAIFILQGSSHSELL